MPRQKNEQILTIVDLKILHLLLENKEPIKIGEINRHLGKYHQRTKDRIDKLLGVFIKETEKPHSKREKPYELIQSEKILVEMILKKWRVLK